MNTTIIPHPQHGKGATNSYLYFAHLPGMLSDARLIVKVFCIPMAKVKRSKTTQWCSIKQASERIELLLAQQKLLEDMGMQVWACRCGGADVKSMGMHKDFICMK
jgi:hypothetical protein